MNPDAGNPAPNYAKPSRLEPTHLLIPEQIAFYHEHGYLAIDAVMPSDEIEKVREICDRLFNEDRSKAEAHFYDLSGAKEEGKKVAIPQILQPAKYAPALLETQLVPNLKGMIKQLHGVDTVMVGDHAINKPPHNESPTPWQQDEAYWDPAKEYSSLSVWVPLQPATKQNGCMHFVPGSHRNEITPTDPLAMSPPLPV